MTRTDTSEAGSRPDAAAIVDSLAVVIVCWRCADLTIDCLKTVESEVKSWPGSSVYVVDNGSGDDSAERLRTAIEANGWQSWVTFIASPVNGGFAAGNNVALRRIWANEQKPEYVLLLNPDTLVRPGAFRILVDFIKTHPKVGIAGGLSENLDATPQHCCFRFPNAFGELSHYLQLGIVDRLVAKSLTRIDHLQQPAQVDWVSGAFMLVRSAVFAEIGLMDESYFLYYEETDFMYRARQAGWQCWHVPASRIVHLVGQSSGIVIGEKQVARRRPKYWFESRRRYFILNHGRVYAAATDLLVVVAYSVRRCREIIQRKNSEEPPRFLSDFFAQSAIFNGKRGLKPRSTQF